MVSFLKRLRRAARLRLLIPAMVLMGSLGVASSIQRSPAGPGIVGFDKVAHLLVFGLLGTLFFRCLKLDLKDHRRWMIALAGVLLYGACDEVLQYFNPARSFEVADWVADVTGASLAIFLYRNWAWYRNFLEIGLGPRLAKDETATSNARR